MTDRAEFNRTDASADGQDRKIDPDEQTTAPEVAGPGQAGDFGASEPAGPADPLFRPAEIPEAAEVEQIFAVMDETDADAAAALRRAWGADAGANIAHGRAAVQALASADLVALLDDHGLGDHPAVLDFAAKVGRRLAGGGPATAAAPEQGSRQEVPRMRTTSEDAPGPLDDELVDLTRQIHDAQDRNDRALRDRLVRQREGIAARLYGTGPVVGGDGRTI